MRAWVLTIGSLFAGIGGIELGLEWAGHGPVLWQVELDPKCRAVLAMHWPEARRYDDVRHVGRDTLAPVDLICGGFPCTDISSAGRRAGLAGPHSGLWYEFARVLAELQPRWVVIENVRGGARKWVDAVRGDLGQLGYSSLPVPIAASDCGAPHERARVFLLGARSTSDTDGEELRKQPGRHRGPERPAAPKPPRPSANADHASSDLRAQARQGVRDVAWHAGWTTEPDVLRVVHGLSGRLDRERMLGNAVVPQCVEVLGRMIVALERGSSAP
jgi:DNA (cytosine-5)-methyltransferase 1